MIIETKSLTKFYGKRRGIEDINLKIEKNSIYGFLGPNGAGKTTTLSSLIGLVRKTRGKVIIDNKDLDKEGEEIKKVVGMMPQDMSAYPSKTAFQNMMFYAKLKDMEKTEAIKQIDSLFKEFEIEEIRNIKVKKLSHGQAKIILIMQTFLGDPKIIILDEPIAGFDPQKVFMLRNILKKKRNQTIVISSHNLEVIDRLCTHIGIIHEGKLILQGKKEKIKKGKSLEKVFIEKLSQ